MSTTKIEPSVTVAIPAFNAARTIRETLDHVLAQTYRPSEIIVSDNHSTDDTPNIVADEYATKGVTLVTCPIECPRDADLLTGSLSVIDNFNSVLDLARGTYVAIYHADDLYDPTIVEREVDFLESHPEAVAVFTMGRTINADGEPLAAFAPPRIVAPQEHALFDLPSLVSAVMIHGAFLMTPTFMVRRSALETAGKLRRTYEQAADYDWWFRLADVGRIGVIGDQLFSHRLGPHQDSYKGHTIYATRAIPIYTLLDDYLKLDRVRTAVSAHALRANFTYRAVDNLRIARNLFRERRDSEARRLLLGTLVGLRPDRDSRLVVRQALIISLTLGLLVPGVFGLGATAAQLQDWLIGVRNRRTAQRQMKVGPCQNA